MIGEREGVAALMFWGEQMQICCLGKRKNRFGVCGKENRGLVLVEENREVWCLGKRRERFGVWGIGLTLPRPMEK